MRMTTVALRSTIDLAASIVRRSWKRVLEARRAPLFALSLACASINAFAYEPNWEWRVSGQSPTFPSHAQAAAFLHSLNDKAALMQNKGLVVADVNYNQFKYEAPRVPKVAKTNWAYTVPYITGSWTTYEASLAAAQADHDSKPNGGCAKGVITPVEDWQRYDNSFPLEPSGLDTRYHVLVGREGYSTQPTPHCNPPGAPTPWGDFRRSRTIGCPYPYDSFTSTHPRCYILTTYTMFGRLISGSAAGNGGNAPGTGNGDGGASGASSGPGGAPGAADGSGAGAAGNPGSTGSGGPNGNDNGSGSGNGNGQDGGGGGGSLCNFRGNPCDVASGEKYEIAVDYVGVGLNFTRYYHSMAEDPSKQLGYNWNHSYQARVILSASVPKALYRPNGAIESLKSVSSTAFVSYMGTGLQLKKVGTEWILYRNDGTFEVYDATGQYLRFNDHGWVTTLTYTDGRVSSIQGPFGHSLTLSYNADGNLQTLTDPA